MNQAKAFLGVHRRKSFEPPQAFFTDTRPLIGYVPDYFGAYEDMVVQEYMEFFAAAYNINGSARTKIVNDVLELTDLAYKRDALAALGDVDLLLTPTLALVPPAADVDELAVRESLIRFTYPFNLLGWPALALPCGPADEDLPASAQLVGRSGADGLVLAAGAWLEAELKA